MVQEGRKAPDFELEADDGSVVRLVRKVFSRVRVDGHAEKVLEALKGL